MATRAHRGMRARSGTTTPRSCAQATSAHATREQQRHHGPAGAPSTRGTRSRTRSRALPGPRLQASLRRGSSRPVKPATHCPATTERASNLSSRTRPATPIVTQQYLQAAPSRGSPQVKPTRCEPNHNLSYSCPLTQSDRRPVGRPQRGLHIGTGAKERWGATVARGGTRSSGTLQR